MICGVFPTVHGSVYFLLLPLRLFYIFDLTYYRSDLIVAEVYVIVHNMSIIVSTIITNIITIYLLPMS